MREKNLAKAINLFPNYFTFTFTRNPFDRFVSYYLYESWLAVTPVVPKDVDRFVPYYLFLLQKQQGILPPRTTLGYKDMRECAELVAEMFAADDLGYDFVQERVQKHGFSERGYEQLRHARYHALRQTDFIPDYNPSCFFGEKRLNDAPCSFIGRQESFEKDFALVLDILGCPKVSIRPLNVALGRVLPDGKIKHYSAYYDKISRRMVEDLYARDLEILGYEFEEEGAISVLNPLYSLQEARARHREKIKLPLSKWIKIYCGRVGTFAGGLKRRWVHFTRVRAQRLYRRWKSEGGAGFCGKYLGETANRIDILWLRVRVFLYSVYRFLSLITGSKKKKVSFCMSVMNRHEQISYTMLENLENNKEFEEDIEFVLVNFINSQEGIKTDQWVRDNFRDEIKSGYLKYFVTDEMLNFEMSVAKNTSHINASGWYLLNLDTDNYVTPEETEFLLDVSTCNFMVHLWSGDYKDGSCGKIGLGAYEFSQLHGYNESIGPIGYEDLDLLSRWIFFISKAVFVNDKRIWAERHMLGEGKYKIIGRNIKLKKALQNTAEEKLANVAAKEDPLGDKELLRRHLCRSNERLAKEMTNDYARLLEQGEIGVNAVRITSDNIDTFFLAPPPPPPPQFPTSG